VIIAAMGALAEHGPGPMSVDAKLLPRARGPLFAALAIGAGVAGSYLASTPPFNEPEPEVEGETPAHATSANGDRAVEEPAGTQA
jgi:hypothetical protein